MPHLPDSLPNNDGVFQIPCMICGSPRFASNDGYYVLGAILNSHSKAFEEAKTKVPPAWLNITNTRRGDFVICVRSNRPLDNDVPYLFVGKLGEHKKYGMQFMAVQAYPDEPTDEVMMAEYLMRLPFVKDVRAAQIVKTFGVKKIPIVIEQGLSELVNAIPGITYERAVTIQKCWIADRHVRRLYMWLLSHNIAVVYGRKIIDNFGPDAIERLLANPYILTEIRGIGFQTADKIAHQLLKDVPKDMRTKSCLEYVLHEKEHEGNLCQIQRRLFAECVKLLGPEDIYTPLLEEMVRQHFVLFGDKYDKIPYVYLPETYHNERYCADFLARMCLLDSDYRCSDEEIKRAEVECATFNDKPDLKFNGKQKEAIRSAFEKKVTVLTGGGGTGKSTICRSICQIAIDKGMIVTQFAPTGQAAKVLNQKTSHQASTIHRGLGLVPGGKRSTVRAGSDSAEVEIDAHILIIDEFSMVGADVLPFVFESISDKRLTNLVFVGDPQQLPSVSPGNNLSDIIASDSANVVCLDQIYRQGEHSYISYIANDIAHGEFKGIPEDADDIVLIPADYGADAVPHITNVVEFHLDKNQMSDLQVLSPIHAREGGVTHTNCLMQKMITEPTDNFISYDGNVYYYGDRVMQTVNNYEKMVFNGNLGYVVDLGRKVIDPMESDLPSAFVTVRMADGETTKNVTYADNEIKQLKLAWCSTVHKFQGSQMKNVLFVLTKSHKFMASRELVYTALTRAEKRVVIVGHEDMLYRAAKNSRIAVRHTNMTKMIRQGIEGTDNLLVRFPATQPTD